MNASYSIGEFAKKTATTIRTLHHYDDLGLLKPSYVNDSGRRFYSDKDFVPLQRIVTLKYLGFSLEEIKGLLQSETWNLKDSLEFQHKLLEQKKEELEKVMKAIQHALVVMDDQQEINPAIFISLIHNIQREDDHKEWLKQFLSEETVEEMFNMPEEKQLDIEKRWASVCAFLKKSTHLEPSEPAVQGAIADMMSLIGDLYGDELKLVEEIADVEIQEDTYLFHSPFTLEEEEWLSKGLHIYLQKQGVDLHGTD